MKYRKDKYGNDISLLGFGCMRFRQEGGKIVLEEAQQQIMAAYRAGVNYYDTAYIYSGSEEALGQILARNQIRDKVYIASKLPHYYIKKLSDCDRYFNEELRRLQTDHIDYYLMHMLTDEDTWKRLCELGIKEWIEDKKSSGAIGQIGFSYHGNSDTFIKLIDEYDWDFCQIQYNYMDENSQAGVSGLRYASSKGLPVIIMEPLRGGKLVNLLPAKAKELMEATGKDDSPAAWAFKWLYNQPEVTCVLSGMNSLEMIEENVKTACESEAGMLGKEDLAVYQKVAEIINEKLKVGCTGCRYCMPCPHGVDIPGTFSAYNRVYSESWFSGQKEYIMNTALRKTTTCASRCIECGACERHCPQHIEIRKELKNARKVVESPVYHIVRFFIRLVRAY